MKKILALLLAVCAVLSFAACGGKQPAAPTTSGSPSPGGNPGESTPGEIVSARDTLTVAVKGDMGTLNSRFMGPGDFKTLSRMYCEPLLDINADGTVRWILATSIEEVSNLQWIVHLREGVTFSNGSPFTAEDVMFSLGDYAWLFYRNIDMETSKALDDYTIELNFTYYDNTLLYSLPLMGIVDAETYDAEAQAVTPIGTGPYLVTEYVVNSHVKMTRNDNYWGAPAKIKDIEFKVLNEDSQRVAALETHTVDSTSVPTQDLDYVKTLPGYEVSVRLDHLANAVFFNVTDKSCLNSTDARKAIVHAIDREAIMNLVYFGNAEMPDWPLMTNCYDYDRSFGNLDAIFTVGYDPDLAKQYAEKAGLYGKTIRIITDGSANYVKMAEMIDQYLKEIGLSASITNYDASSYLVTRENPDTHDIWLGNLSHPALSGAAAYQGNVRNNPYVWESDWPHSEEFKELSQAVIGMHDEDEIKAGLRRLTEMFSESLLWYPICQPNTQNAYDAKLAGVQFMLLGGTYYNEWYWVS